MNKKLLLEKYIKVAVRKALKEQEEQQRKAEKAMYLVYRFPGLKKLIENLMSPSFGRFVSGIDILAPKPTVFKVSLVNGQDFTITYLGKNSYSIKVAGKKYFDKNLAEIQRASVAISELLEYSYAAEETPAPAPTTGEVPVEAPAGGAPTGEVPAAKPTAKDQELAATLAAEETPASEEETPTA
jgi:hypothetical protein